MRRFVSLAVCAASLAGCAAKYPKLGADVPSAELRIVRSDVSRIWRGVSTDVWLFENPNCTETEVSGHLAMLLFGDRDAGTRRIQAGSRVYLLSQTLTEAYSPGAGQGTTTHSACASQVSFVPRVGSRYELAVLGSGVTCGLTLTDETGAVPEGFDNTPPTLDCSGPVAFYQAVSAMQQKPAAK